MGEGEDTVGVSIRGRGARSVPEGSAVGGRERWMDSHAASRHSPPPGTSYWQIGLDGSVSRFFACAALRSRRSIAVLRGDLEMEEASSTPPSACCASLEPSPKSSRYERVRKEGKQARGEE